MSYTVNDKFLVRNSLRATYYNDVITGVIASQITSLTIVYSIVYSGADQRKHQSSTSLAFVRGIHQGPVNSPHKGPVTWKMFPFDMVPTGSDEWKLRTFQGPFQDQISHYKDFYGEFHNANIPNIPHICGNFLLFSFLDITSDLIGYLFYILKESWQNVHFGIGCLLNW